MGTDLLRFADVESLQDLGTLVARARTLDDAGAIRLQAGGGVLAAWVCVLPGRGVLGQGVVLGLRVMPLEDSRAQLDTTVPLAAISDRLAWRERTGDIRAELPVPPAQAGAPWAALTPPRSGWEPAGSIASDDLVTAAREGIAEVAQGAPEGSGGHAVAALRERVWSRPLGEEPPAVPAGAGLAAYGLGFARPGERATLLQAGPWTRVTLEAGHVLTR